jgi:mannose-6-phosphate isomerase-like protein (cupin superfamily)
MNNRILVGAAALVGAFALGRATSVSAAGALENGSVIEHDSVVAAKQAGPHKGGGQTTGYSFFTKSKDLKLVFRKRALHAGSAIGYHKQAEDEIYYVVSGTGEFTLDGVKHIVGPGTAMLTRTGSSHSIKPTGKDDLVIIISYLNEPRKPEADASTR